MPLRDYQQDAVDAVMAHIRKCTSSCLIDCPTGSGKSWIAAYIARGVHELSGKRVLVLAPSAELVEQNHGKYLATGNPASMYSASTGRKELRHDVVFGSPLTVANNLHKFSVGFAAVIIDEAHGITPTLIKIINHMREHNPNLRVIGMSATCYRMKTGYIYRCHYERGFLDDEETINPFFDHLVYSIPAAMLIERGYLTPPVFESSNVKYDTSGLVMKKTGQWDESTVNQAFVGHGRKTSAIVAEVVEKSVMMNGVMFFAATIQHANEVVASLPPECTGIVTGKTPKKERRDILLGFQNRKLKYLVNVACLTTGFDATHVDHVAILRATESPGLLQQIIGRGLRLDDGKSECLISDYAENVERHFPAGDVFSPEIKTSFSKPGEGIKVSCPVCRHENDFTVRPNPDNFEISDDGYFIDLAGDKVEVEGRQLPAHFGRRCKGYSVISGKVERCSYKWAFKECPDCGHENDIAARYCTGCKSEIVDPNEKLKQEAARVAKDPYATKFDSVESWSMSTHTSRAGNECLKVSFVTEGGQSIDDWFHPASTKSRLLDRWQMFSMKSWGRVMGGIQDAVDSQQSAAAPIRIAYRKDHGSKYYKLVGMEYENT